MENLEYGPVIITRGKHKGRIGCYDDENDSGKKGFVYWGDMVMSLDDFDLIPLRSLSSEISTYALVNRIEQLQTLVARIRAKTLGAIDYRLCTQLLSELLYAESVLNQRYIETTYLTSKQSVGIFISHSSEDLTFSRCLATDLKKIGCDVFLDDWSIDLGENIVTAINKGLDNAKVLIPIVSQNFLESVFCTDEWTSFYLQFGKTKNNSIIPIIIDASTVPLILSARKYYDYYQQGNYSEFLRELRQSLVNL